MRPVAEGAGPRGPNPAAPTVKPRYFVFAPPGMAMLQPCETLFAELMTKIAWLAPAAKDGGKVEQFVVESVLSNVAPETVQAALRSANNYVRAFSQLAQAPSPDKKLRCLTLLEADEIVRGMRQEDARERRSLPATALAALAELHGLVKVTGGMDLYFDPGEEGEHPARAIADKQEAEEREEECDAEMAPLLCRGGRRLSVRLNPCQFIAAGVLTAEDAVVAKRSPEARRGGYPVHWNAEKSKSQRRTMDKLEKLASVLTQRTTEIEFGEFIKKRDRALRLRDIVNRGSAQDTPAAGGAASGPGQSVAGAAPSAACT